VNVDEAGGDDEPGNVEIDGGAFGGEVADAVDEAVADEEVGAVGFGAGAVDDGAVAEDDGGRLLGDGGGGEE